MKKYHDLKTVVSDHIAINYFYRKEKRNVNGNPRFRVYIMDPDAPIVHETIFKTYEGLISSHVLAFVEEAKSNV
jgi:hypothetical protein